MADLSPEYRRRLLELSWDLRFVAGFDGVFRELSPEWSNALGWSTAELTSRPYLEFVHPDDIEATVAEAAGLVTSSGTRPTQFENRYRRKDGTWCWLEWRAAAFDDDQVYVGVARDISMRKRLERFREAHHDVSSLLAGAPAPVEVLPTALGIIGSAIEWDLGAVWQADHDDGLMACLTTWGDVEDARASYERMNATSALRIGEGVPGTVVATGSPHWSSDVSSDPVVARPALAHGEPGRTLACVPVMAGTTTIGAVEFIGVNGQVIDEPLQEMLVALGHQLGQFLHARHVAESMYESHAIQLGDGVLADLMQVQLALRVGRPGRARQALDHAITTVEGLIDETVAGLRGEQAGGTSLAPPQPGGTVVATIGADGEVLSERETEVLRLVAHGATNRDIGNALNISVDTAKSHVANVRRKLGVSSREAAVAEARRRGMLDAA